MSGQKPPERILSPPARIDDREFSGFYAPQFAPGNRFVYFLIAYAPTTLAIARLSLADDSLKFITRALQYQVVKRGNFVGYLIVQQRRLYATGGVYAWYWLMDPDGTEAALIGQDEKAVRNFLADTAH